MPSRGYLITLLSAELFCAYYKMLSFKLNHSKYFKNFSITTDLNQNLVVSQKTIKNSGSYKSLKVKDIDLIKSLYFLATQTLPNVLSKP